MRRAMAIALMVVGLLQGAMAARAGPARDVIQGLNAKFIEVMQNAATLGYDGRYQSLAPALAAAYDFSEMTRVSAGRYWRDLSAAQRAQLVAAFTDYSTATYAARFDGFAGARFQILGEEPALTDGVRVINQIVPGSGDPIRIDYLLRQRDGQWRIIDVYLKASVSELAVRRAEFTDLLSGKGFEGLLADLRAKVGKLQSDAAGGQD